MPKMNRDIFDGICAEIRNGATLRSVCRTLQMDHGKVLDFIEAAEDDEISNQYARALDIRADVWADEAMDVARDENGEVNHRKLLTSEIHWHIERAKPRKYGSHQTIQLDGEIKVSRSKEVTDRAVRAAMEADE